MLLRVFLYPLNEAVFRHDHALSNVKRREIFAPKEIVSICAGNAQNCGNVVCAQAERQLLVLCICQIQPDPGFSDDNNYLKNSFAEAEHVNPFNWLDKQTVIASDGTNLTELVEKAVA